MWNAAHQFERAAEWAAAERARRALLNAIGYDEPVQPPPLPRYDEQLREWFSHSFVPFSIWIIKAFFLAVILLMLSIGTYAAIWALAMRGLNVQSRPIFFDYSPVSRISSNCQDSSMMPIGTVDLRSTKSAPWAHSSRKELGQSAVGEVCTNNDNKIIFSNAGDGREDSDRMDPTLTSEASILEKGQMHFFEVVLTLPESEINKQLGVFMVNVDLRSDDGSLLASSKQHSMLPYESALLSLFRKMMLILPLASGLLSETKTISLLCFDQYADANDKKPMSLVEVSLEIPNPAAFPATLQTIQIHSAEIRFGKEMNSIQVLLHNWRYACAFFGIAILSLGYTLATLSVLHRRAQRDRLNSQPYADFFDSDDESANNSNSSSNDMWMGTDIEILDDDEIDQDAWEPIRPEANRDANVGDNSAQEQSTDNMVSDDESFSSRQRKSKAVPSVNVANNSKITGHETLFASNPKEKAPKRQDDRSSPKKSSQEKEEQCLADMVMKGRSKWGTFTGEMT